mmetsp:Transcript_17225/g.24543  ORF Transcript_17225/g.24543 Transcript_17225/m.24543 type:complete len:108 (+) Transcript_17225:66-389(+)
MKCIRFMKKKKRRGRTKRFTEGRCFSFSSKLKIQKIVGSANLDTVWLSSRLLVGVFFQLVAVFLFLATVLVIIRSIIEWDKPDILICSTMPTCDRMYVKPHSRRAAA